MGVPMVGIAGRIVFRALLRKAGVNAYNIISTNLMF